MLRSMTLTQFEEWKVFYDLEPFDEEREDLRFASLTQAIYNVNRNPKKRSSPFTLEEVRLRFGDAKPRQKSWQEMEAIGKAFAMAHGAVPRKRAA